MQPVPRPSWELSLSPGASHPSMLHQVSTWAYLTCSQGERRCHGLSGFPLEGLHFDFTSQASRKGASLAGITMAAAAAAQAMACVLCKALLSQPQHDVPSLTAPRSQGGPQT